MNLLRCLFLAFALPSMLVAQVDPEEFHRIPPKSPQEELKQLHVKSGFRLELVAAEPLVQDPVAMCFDEHRRLFVVELHDHQHLPDPKTSKVKMLTDDNGDGRYDRASVLAEGLSWTTAIAPWDGGVFIGASPELIYLKDTDGDGRADIKETILTGFDHNKNGELSKSYHHERSLNNLNWAPGNRFFCAGGMNGGYIKNLIHPDSEPMELRKLDFSFDPLRRTARPETGSSQHGMAVDDWGNRYQTTNSNPALFPAYDLRYRLRNPGAALPAAMASIAQPDSKGPVYRRSGTEPWREARTRLRAAGLERGPVEEGGTVSGYFTGTADSVIYRGSRFPAEYYGDLFVGEVSENVVHHRKIHFPEDQVEPIALRPDDEADYEFIASSDNWFRPVQLINGPDGALYICDMYREVVEAWHTIPEYIREHLDRDSGKELGRIWRVVPESGATENTDFVDLVAALKSPEGWVRDTASRLIYQRQNKELVPLLIDLLKGATPQTSLATIYALDGLGALRKEHLNVLLKSPEPGARVHGIRLLEKLKAPPGELAPLIQDADPRVLYQLAFTFGNDPGESLSLIARQLPDDPWLAMAVASSLDEKTVPAFLKDCFESGDFDSQASLAASREAGRLKVSLQFPRITTEWIPVLQAYGEGLKRSKSSLSKMLTRDTLKSLKKLCFDTIDNEVMTIETRVTCLEFLPLLGLREKDLLAKTLPLLVPGTPEVLQMAAVSVFRAGARSEAAGESLVATIPKSAANLRPELIQLLTRRITWCRQLLTAVETGKLSAGEIPVSAAGFLRRHSDADIAKWAGELLPAPADRSKVVAEFQKSMTLNGDIENGEATFRGRCLICHQLGQEGGRVGPAMGEFQRHGKGKILLNLLDPNKTIQPDYIGWVLSARSGEAVIGRVLEDTGTAVTLRDMAGNDRQFARDQIESLVSTGRSLMPEGIEAGLSEQDLADLLAFITSHRL